ncbi:molybdate ABC transporter substrate-binding protein [Novosphingobium jiangmenense]|uniref:Molybdate ABC transporter substrate-binding protein n=1 Tax=Novosphingobium jiangmenense TaxID=2791981 RepID=A0ABS0HEZ1_9SPHN|nr:molybdate ABC transporter substrate-binding protein [Novosphingobium jiangmenense]MBF9150829.1 molybdate ABC transporter substrate-binding protein [Novosphingobium jiangmenense]
MMPPILRRAFLALLLALGPATPALAQDKGPLVLAAASLQEAMTDAATAWARKGHPRPVLSFAASSALARQAEAGARADLFASADEEWMDYLQRKSLLKLGTRARLTENRLVLIAPAQSRVNLRTTRNFALAKALGTGRLAMADPAAVPAGRYGREALTKLGVWTTVAGKVAAAENVRAALALVERGAAPLGIVYATDAMASRAVRVIGTFPAASHQPITYPVALLASSRHRDAEAFRRFLISREGRAIFLKRGFGQR